MRTAPLGRLRRVSGVLGSFTCTETGQLLGADMPERYSRADLESTAARLTNIFQSVEDVAAECSDVRLAFAEHQLLVRRYQRGLLCVLARSDFDRHAFGAATAAVIAELAVG